MDNRDQIVELFGMLCRNFAGARMGKKVTQKMFYFFERKGISLNLKYGIHYYGPYSSKLDTVMHVLESDDFISIDTTGPTHVISLNENCSNVQVLSQEEKDIANSVITDFAQKTPLELEALATMDYVANSISKETSRDEVIKTFKIIKGKKFSDQTIESTYDELKKYGLINSL